MTVDAGLGEGAAAVGVGAVAGDQPGRRLARRHHQAGEQRRAQVAVHDHAHQRHRLGSRAMPAGQVGIVGEHGADADQHRVVPAAQRVRQAPRAARR